MKILLVEPEYQGHHVALHLNLLINEFHKRKWHISILTYKKSIISEPYKLIDKKIFTKIDFFYIKKVNFTNSKNIFYLICMQVIKYYNIITSIKKILSKNHINHIYFVTGDHIDKILAILGNFSLNIKFSLMLINSKVYLNKNINFIEKIILFIKKKLLFNLIDISYLKNLFVVDLFLYKFIKKNKKNNFFKVEYIPDPGQLKFLFLQKFSKNLLNIKKEDFIILIYGAIKMSKGIKEIIYSLQLINNQKIKLIIAGKQTDDVKSFLALDINKKLIKSEKIIIYDGFKDYKEEAILFSASDVVWVGYNNNFSGSSGVLHQAGLVKKPVITNRMGLLGYLNKRHKIGVRVNLSSSVDIKNKILYLYRNKIIRNMLGKNNYILSKKHSGKKFALNITNKILNAK
jgi:glycosyltransferase involved in cell wall biosynthesis